MITVTVLKGFRDLKQHTSRRPGDTFEANEERAAQLAAALPGFIAYDVPEPEPEPNPKPAAEPEPSVDLSKLTVAKLKALCGERGIEVPAKAKKADLIALLDKE